MSDQKKIMDNWYLDDQFARQFQTPVAKDIIFNRFGIFKKSLKPILSRKKPVNILDAGCGDGINTQELEKYAEGFNRGNSVTGIDSSKIRVARVRKKIKGPVILGTLNDLPFENNSFDAVLCNHVIEHIPQPNTAMSEIFRILKPDGILIIGVPNEGCILASIRNNILQRSILKTTDHVNFFTKKKIKQLIESSGFTVEAVFTEGFFLPHLRLTTIFRSYWLGHKFLVNLGRLIPSQAAGLIVVCKCR